MKSKLAVARIFCAGFDGVISVDGVSYESGLFMCDDAGDGDSFPNLGGQSRASQSREFLDYLFGRFANFNGGGDGDGEAWERSDNSHLQGLLEPNSGFFLLGPNNSVSTTNPIASDGRFHVSCQTSRSDVSVLPLHEVALLNTVFLLVRRITD